MTQRVTSHPTPEDGPCDRIIEACAGLRAVVSATERATEEIMQAAEVLMTAAEAANDAAGETVVIEATRVFEACTFQDITGQHVNKVIDTLTLIERRLRALGLTHVIGEAKELADPDQPPLEGPQLYPGDGLAQQEIDLMLADG